MCARRPAPVAPDAPPTMRLNRSLWDDPDPPDDLPLVKHRRPGEVSFAQIVQSIIERGIE